MYSSCLDASPMTPCPQPSEPHSSSFSSTRPPRSHVSAAAVTDGGPIIFLIQIRTSISGDLRRSLGSGCFACPALRSIVDRFPLIDRRLQYDSGYYGGKFFSGSYSSRIVVADSYYVFTFFVCYLFSFCAVSVCIIVACFILAYITLTAFPNGLCTALASGLSSAPSGWHAKVEAN